MAEAIVSAVVETLGTLLIHKAISFTTFFTGVHEQFQLLQEELVSIQGFLSTADSNHNQDPGIRAWVSDVRDIAYDVDDVIDAYLLKVAYNEEGESSFERYAHKPKKLLDCYKLNKKMDNLLSELKHISERRKRYDGITQRIVPSNKLLRREYSHITDDVTIGLEEQTNELVTKLLKEEDRLCVVSIYGMGGLGKTTLAKKVYNLPDVKSHFDCYAWTSISQQMRTKEVLKEIIRNVNTQTNNDISDLSEPELVRKLFRLLDGRRYLVVLDDIWNTEDWDVLKKAFPKVKGSKILFTTRNKKVAEHADLWSCHYEPRSLTNEEAWELLCKKAFPPNVIDSSYSLSSDKEKCGRDMVKKCGGLPLAIIVLGGLLASKSSFNEWEAVSKKIGIVGRGSGEDDVAVLSILSLSYLELPYQLKPLFLYLGLFPEDSIIPVKRLVCMWMAEGLIKNQEGETMEEVGRRYLDELIHRSMVQMVEKSLVGGRAKTCRLHDKMRDLCIDIGKKENFFELVSHQNSDSASSSSIPCSKLRRCTINIEKGNNQYVFPKHLTPCLRTVFFISKKCPNMVYKDFQLLKVLQFQGDKDFGVLEKLSNLRYLEINVYLDEAVLMCSQLHQLRHLYVFFKLSKINKMTKLQTLWKAQAGPWMTDLVKLTNLEKLGIYGLDDKTMELLTIAIRGGGLDKLRSLFLWLEDDVFFSDLLLDVLSEKYYLQKLNLWGKLKKLPSQWPSNLIKLTLLETDLSEDPMPTLENLQQLLWLRLFGSYRGKQMVCSTKGFPKLQYLEVSNFIQLDELVVEEGAMPCLLTCQIENCRNLKMVPQGFTKLQELTILGMPESFVQRVKEGGEDWDTIKQIPSIIVTNWQKVVIKVSTSDAKSRIKAMKIAVSVPGVISAELQGDSKNQILVTGDGIDSTYLTKLIRKKLGFTKLIRKKVTRCNANY